MKTYKGFDKDFKCRDFQYEVGREYEMPDDDIKVCERGFHACESPLEVLDHYFLDDNAQMCRFAEVEQSGKIDRENGSTKVCSSKIKIKAELKFGDLIKAGNEWLKEVTRPKGHPEHDLQVACVAWFRAQYPEDAAMLFAVPNGGRRGAFEAKRLKDEGATAGVSDLIYLEARGGYGALCIETKTRRKGSGQSDKQKEWQLEAERHGNKYVVARDIAAFCREITAYKRLPRITADAVVQVSIEGANIAVNARKSGKKFNF